MGALTLIVAGTSLVPLTLAVVLRSRVPAPVTVCLAHVAATGLLVSLAASDSLCARTTWLLGKRSDGSIAPLQRLLFWPYFAGLFLKLGVQRRRSSEPLYDRVTPQLYIGGWPEQAGWLPPGQPSVLDVTCELPRRHHHHYLMIPTWDTQAPNAAQIQLGVEWTLRELADGHPVYVHCAHGHGRSATVLAAVLIASGQADSAEEAVSIMRAARPRVRLNKAQAAALRSWIAAGYAASLSGKGAQSCAVSAAAEGHRQPRVVAGGTADVTVADGAGGSPTKRQQAAAAAAARLVDGGA